MTFITLHFTKLSESWHCGVLLHACCALRARTWPGWCEHPQMRTKDALSARAVALRMWLALLFSHILCIASFALGCASFEGSLSCDGVTCVVQVPLVSCHVCPRFHDCSKGHHCVTPASSMRIELRNKTFSHSQSTTIHKVGSQSKARSWRAHAGPYEPATPSVGGWHTVAPK